ncbi:hypothetical protein KFU94_19135 [Chloroflexi bacterium TSY]|nr:hypothetical protein [Chloroflexi bacterium TSY]
MMTPLFWLVLTIALVVLSRLIYIIDLIRTHNLTRALENPTEIPDGLSQWAKTANKTYQEVWQSVVTVLVLVLFAHVANYLDKKIIELVIGSATSIYFLSLLRGGSKLGLHF